MSPRRAGLLVVLGYAIACSTPAGVRQPYVAQDGVVGPPTPKPSGSGPPRPSATPPPTVATPEPVPAPGAGSASTPEIPPRTPPPPNRLRVSVDGLRNNTGTVRCFLYGGPVGFPKSTKHIIAKAVALPTAHKAVCRFSGIRPNHDYAVVMIHDENNDAQFQKNALGIPEEGYGFSNNVQPRLSPPSFDECKVHVGEGLIAIAITTRY